MKAWGACSGPAGVVWPAVVWAILVLLLARRFLDLRLELARAEHCGLGHYRGRWQLTVVPPGELPPHPVVAEAAMLGAGDLEGPGLPGNEPGLRRHPRHRVLLHPEVGEEEAVDHVEGADAHPHRASLREEELVLEGDVVLGRGVSAVEADE